MKKTLPLSKPEFWPVYAESLAEYNLDILIVRLFALQLVFWGTGFLFYIILIIIPKGKHRWYCCN